MNRAFYRRKRDDLRGCMAMVAPINALEPQMRARSDAELRQLTEVFRKRLQDGEDLDELLPEAFAAMREASVRTLGKRHFDVQLVGGVALHWGHIAEMKTGEGKTLVATLPSYLNALGGGSVHVVTVNDYLARRDAEWMEVIHRFLGLDVGVLSHTTAGAERRRQYAAAVTYGTGNELGWDYLRDNMALSTGELVQRGHHYAIVDDVDSVLIDQARTPLLLLAPADGDAHRPEDRRRFARVAAILDRDVHYEVDEGRHLVTLGERGVAKVEELLGLANLYDPPHVGLLHDLLNALRAKELYKRDDEYIVRDGEVLIVDEFTGRVLEDRRYSEGLHQAIEAKEGVRIKEENQTYATITLQNYFRMYDKLAGMTGTAKTEAAELRDVYGLAVVEVPTNRPTIRVDHADIVYRTEQAKLAALVDEVAERHEQGQPILVGTVSIEKSERVSRLLDQRGIKHSVLNAKHHEREAHIIAQAGRLGAVTVATNMAGRGVDIMLGGDRVVELGGLAVLGTERHESRRIDDQLRGRSGRQGDPGASRFYLSLEDDLMRGFASGPLGNPTGRLGLRDEAPISHRLVTRAVADAQRQVERRNFQRRKAVLGFDEVLDEQRRVVYGTRRAILEGGQLRERVRGFLGDAVTDLVDQHCPRGAPPGEWHLGKLFAQLGTLYPAGVRQEDADLERTGRASLQALLLSDAERAYQAREAELGPDRFAELERWLLLSVLDRHWREHLDELDSLHDVLWMLAIGQRDPLVEYRRRAVATFQAMQASLKRQVAAYVFDAAAQASWEAGPQG